MKTFIPLPHTYGAAFTAALAAVVAAVVIALDGELTRKQRKIVRAFFSLLWLYVLWLLARAFFFN